jgi:Asp-tRNA(Asn)/Glu-tRNA(Gln) amidotransferase A subunit family amidase
LQKAEHLNITKVIQIKEDSMNENVYDLKSVKLPRLAGKALKVFVGLLDSPAGKLLIPKLLKDAGIEALREMIIDENPTFYPFREFENTHEKESADCSGLGRPYAGGFKFPSSADYHKAYIEGTLTPEEVAQRVIKAIETSNSSTPALRAIIACRKDDVMNQAAMSAARYREGRPLSVFDGVPVAVKDELDMLPYPTTVGTKFLGHAPAKADATVVARMRASGAMLIGKANMHEIGIGVTGQNTHHGTPRNPYNPGHYTGGSSSGPACAVAAGLCPISIGADGGGSIRIPSSFCGAVGIKSTFGRVSEYGAAPLCWSVAHVGPIATDVKDAVLSYAMMAGADKNDPNSLKAPQISLDNIENTDLKDLKIGVYWPWFRHASPEVVSKCEEVLKQLASLGADIVDVVIPGLEATRVSHVITITSEMNNNMQRYWDRHKNDFSLEVKSSLILARSFTARDYVQAQRVRTKTIESFDNALKKVNVIATPSTGITAPLIPLDSIPDGESDLTTLTEIMRFAVAGNFTGLPAISFPAGYDSKGLPVGFQAMGRPWEENVLFRLAYAAQTFVQKQKPEVFYELI